MLSFTFAGQSVWIVLFLYIRTVLYQNQPFSGLFEGQNIVLKMSLVIFEPERRSMHSFTNAIRSS